MGEFFPVKSQQQLVTNVIREEEASFLRTLDQGLQLLDKVMKMKTTVAGVKHLNI
jgi:alanyl-tRNA synthetase